MRVRNATQPIEQYDYGAAQLTVYRREHCSLPYMCEVVDNDNRIVYQCRGVSIMQVLADAREICQRRQAPGTSRALAHPADTLENRKIWRNETWTKATSR